MINKHGNFRFFLPLGFVLALAGVLFAQSTPNKNKILVVNGKSAGPAVRQIDGRSYVDIETLAQVTNGVFTVERHRILLTLPASDSVAAASAAPASAPPVNVATGPADAADAAPASAPPPQPPPGLSRDFASAAIAALAEMRELRGAVRAMITYGLAVSDTWAQDDQGRVMTGIRQAEVAASTDADLNALQLLQNEADQLGELGGQCIRRAPGPQWREDRGSKRPAERSGTGKNPELRAVSECHARQRRLCRRPQLPLAPPPRAARAPQPSGQFVSRCVISNECEPSSSPTLSSARGITLKLH